MLPSKKENIHLKFFEHSNCSTEPKSYFANILTVYTFWMVRWLTASSWCCVLDKALYYLSGSPSKGEGRAGPYPGVLQAIHGRHFSVLLFTCKLALAASFKGKYYFEFRV